jgi:hypothetical protein
MKMAANEKTADAIMPALVFESALRALEDWRGGHKSRSVRIDCDDGYGSSCWEVALNGNGKAIVVSEPTAPDGDQLGLAATIEAALARAAKEGL